MGSRRRHLSRWAMGLAAALAVLALAGCGVNTSESVLSPAGPVAQAELGLFQDSVAIMIGVFLVVAAALTYVLVRFRQRPGQTGPAPEVEGNNTLEVAWTVGPLLLLLVLGVLTWKDAFALSGPSPNRQALTVDVVGHQFWWEFDYPGQGVVTADVLHVPVGRPVNLVLTSKDVIHSFWIPRLGGKLDAVPGRVNTMWFEASRPGIYPGECAEFCGTGHAYMRMEVVAQSPAAFDAWVAAMRHPESQPHSALAHEGYLLFEQKGCFACHTIGGTPYQGQVGPNLTDFSARPGIAALTLPNTPQNLARWLHDPQAVKPGALMPNLHLSHDDIQALVAYLEGLK